MPRAVKTATSNNDKDDANKDPAEAAPKYDSVEDGASTAANDNAGSR